MNIRYVKEKFLVAEELLAVGEGDIKERVLSAYMCFHPVRPEDLPEELQIEYAWVMGQLTRKPTLAAPYGDKLVSGSVE